MSLKSILISFLKRPIMQGNSCTGAFPKSGRNFALCIQSFVSHYGCKLYDHSALLKDCFWEDRKKMLMFPLQKFEIIYCHKIIYPSICIYLCHSNAGKRACRAQSEYSRAIISPGASQINHSKNYFRYVTGTFLKFMLYMLSFILQYSYFFRSEAFQEVLQTSMQRNIIFREIQYVFGNSTLKLYLTSIQRVQSVFFIIIYPLYPLFHEPREAEICEDNILMHVYNKYSLYKSCY